MLITERELFTVLHGLILGSLYLLAFAGGAEALWSLKPAFFVEEKIKRIKIGLSVMVVSSWLTVISGTYVIYIWYRAKVPDSPRSKLLADPVKAVWHTFGMEWKEHVAWLAPILTTVAAFLVFLYKHEVWEKQEVRRAAFWLLSLGFASAAIAGLFGAFINKVSPII